MTEAAEAPATAPPGLRLSIAHLATVVPWLALVIGAWGPVSDSSFLWHVRAGTVQAQSGSVLTSDVFSFTMGGQPWRTQSWLAELLYGWLESITGLAFVPWVVLIATACTFAGVALVAYRRSRSVTATVFILVLTTFVMMSFTVPRPVVFSYALMALVVLAWERRGTRWTLPFLMWIFASVHASFVVALAYLGISTLIRKEWREIPVLVASGIPTLLTAHGVGVLEFLLAFGQNRDALEFISEWRQPGLLSPLFIPFLGGLVFIVIGLLRRKVPPAHLGLVVPFVILGSSAVRAIPPAWIALVPVIAMALSGLEIGSTRRLRPRLAVAFFTVVLVLPFLLVEPGGHVASSFPDEALASLSKANTFHDDRVGGFLIWAEGPNRKVFVDDRAELYGSRLEEFVKLRNGDADWEVVFTRDEIGQALLAVSDPIVTELNEAGWVATYEDESYVVLVPGDS